MRNVIAPGYARNRLMSMIPARTEKGDLPTIPRGIKPALTQMAHAEVTVTALLRNSLQCYLGGIVEWDHYGLAVRSVRGYAVVVKQLLELGCVDTGIEFNGATPACFLQFDKNPRVPIKVFVVNSFTARNRETAQLAYLAFTVGNFWQYAGKKPWNEAFKNVVTRTQRPVVGQEVLGIDQQGVMFGRKEIEAQRTTQKGILDGYTFPHILILDRHTPTR